MRRLNLERMRRHNWLGRPLHGRVAVTGRTSIELTAAARKVLDDLERTRPDLKGRHMEVGVEVDYARLHGAWITWRARS